MDELHEFDQYMAHLSEVWVMRTGTLDRVGTALG